MNLNIYTEQHKTDNVNDTYESYRNLSFPNKHEERRKYTMHEIFQCPANNLECWYYP